ncbi:unnamed protein product [Closterium sp. NIES-53]
MTLRPSTAPQRVPLPSPPASSFLDGPDRESDSLRAASPTVTRFLATPVTDPLFESSAASALVAKLVDFAAPCRLVYATSLVAESASASVCPPYVGGECALSTYVLEDRQEEFECFAAVWSLRRPVYGLRQAPREWHDTLRTTLAALGFAPSTADPSLFLRTDATLLPFYVLVYVDDLVFATADTEALAHVKSELQKRHTCTDLGPSALRLHVLLATTLPSDKSVEPSGPYPELVGCLMYLMTCTRPDLAYPLSLRARYVAPGRHRKVHWDAAKRVLRYLCNTSGMGLMLGGRARVVLTGHADASWVDDLATQRSSSCEAEIYAGAMAALELRWLTYLLNDLGEAPCSPPVQYIDNKAMLALCLEHRLEHRTKHIARRYFLARELQQRGQLRLIYVASQANTADVFTKALQPCDHQPCFAFLDWSCDLLFSPTLPMGVCQT